MKNAFGALYGSSKDGDRLVLATLDVPKPIHVPVSHGDFFRVGDRYVLGPADVPTPPAANEAHYFGPVEERA